MEDILKAIIEANQAASRSGQAPAQGSDPLADLIGGILGGGGAMPAAPSQPTPGTGAGGLDITDIIGALIGANASRGEPHHNGIADMIGAIMGGGSGSSQQINPIAQMLADKLGIPPAIAQMAVTFFLSKIFQGQAGQMMPGANGGASGGSFQPEPESGGALDLDDLLDSMDDTSGLQARFSNSGMAGELAAQTGLSEDDANKTLQEIVKIVGGERVKPRPVNARKSNLKNLLDVWD